jgi:VWFA-related protein
VAAQQAPPVDTGQTIRSSATEVVLDLVVRDKKGKLVKNLKPGDVEIYEDGVRQEIRSFRMVTAAEAPPAAPAPATPAAQPAGEPPKPAAATHPSEIPLRDADLVCIIFHKLDAGTKKWAVEAAQEFIKTQARPDTYIGVFNLDSQLTPLQPFTNNREQLLRAAAGAFFGSTVDISQASEAVLNSTPNLQLYVGFVSAGGKSGGVQDMSTTGSVAMAAITGADVDNGPGANAQRGDLVIEREQFIGIEGAKQMGQIKTLIKQLSRFPGHKSVLLFSPGFTTTGDPTEFQAMLNQANSSGLSFYAFDANGLGITSTAQSSSVAMQHVTTLSQQQGQLAPGEAQQNVSATGAAGAMMERVRQSDYQINAVRTSDTQSGLRALSEGTGGFLVANTNDLRKPFKQIAEDSVAHYETHYHSSLAKYDGRFHKVEVKLARADWKVENRNGYFALPDFGAAGKLRPFEMAGLMTLNGSPLPHTFDFRTAAFQFRPGDGNSQTAILFDLPGSALTATPVPERHVQRLRAALFAMVKDAEGNIVDKYSREFAYEIPDGQLGGIQGSVLDYTHAFNLPPGHYTLESVLFDREGKRASTTKTEFESPQRKGIALSSVVLVSRAEPLTGKPDDDDPLLFQGREVVPALDAKLKADAKPLAYFVIYPDRASTEKARIRVSFVVNGKVLSEKEADLPAADASGAIPMLVNAAMRPGDCELRITALQGTDAPQQSISYTVPGTPKPEVEVATQGSVPAPSADDELDFNVKLPEVDPVEFIARANVPSIEEQDRLWQDTVSSALNYSGSLPNFRCKRENRRLVAPLKAPDAFKQSDAFLEQLTYENNRESYHTLEVNGQKSDAHRESLKGLRSSGEFGRMLEATLDPEVGPTYKWVGHAVATGVLCDVFEIEVPREKSHFAFTFNARREVARVTGRIFVNPETHLVRRITLQGSDLPKDFGLQSPTLSLEFGKVRIGDSDYLLPLHSVLQAREGKTVVRNETQFRDYKKFDAASNIRF